LVVTKRPAQLELVGGDPALLLINTHDGERGGAPTADYVTTPADLVEWAARAGLPSPEDPAQGLEDFRRLRAVLYPIFFAIADGRRPPARALAELAEIHAAALASARLEPRGGGFDYRPAFVLTPVQAAVDLLRHGPLDRLKSCADCRWVFLDRSRNRSRVWCSMNECGGRLKMQRYRARRATAGR
jgi:predicted RNA-binding Zn ribbon-like protein